MFLIDSNLADMKTVTSVLARFGSIGNIWQFSGLVVWK
jgi:hypothetical protein